jgi:hypothetical protein
MSLHSLAGLFNNCCTLWLAAWSVPDIQGEVFQYWITFSIRKRFIINLSDGMFMFLRIQDESIKNGQEQKGVKLHFLGWLSNIL